MKEFVIYSQAFILALAPALIWLYIWYKKDSKEPEPKRLIFRAFLFGALAIMPFFGIAHVLQYSPNLLSVWGYFEAKTFYLSTIILTTVLAFLEESLKHFAVLRLGSKLKINFNQIVDGIVYSVSAALGFAFAENMLYFSEYIFLNGINTDFLLIFGFRSFATMVGHTIFSGIFGLFWGFAFLSKKITPNHKHSVIWFWHSLWGTLRFHIIIVHILKNKPSKKGHEKVELIAEALLLATIVHAVFNLLIKTEIFGHSLTFVVVPIVTGGFVFLSHAFLKKKNLKIWHKAI